MLGQKPFSFLLNFSIYFPGRCWPSFPLLGTTRSLRDFPSSEGLRHSCAAGTENKGPPRSAQTARHIGGLPSNQSSAPLLLRLCRGDHRKLSPAGSARAAAFRAVRVGHNRSATSAAPYQSSPAWPFGGRRLYRGHSGPYLHIKAAVAAARGPTPPRPPFNTPLTPKIGDPTVRGHPRTHMQQGGYHHHTPPPRG